MKTIGQVLAENEFLKGMQAAHLEQLGDCAMNVVFEEGSLLMEPGREADRFYVIRSGEVGLDMPYENGSIPIERLKAGDFLGWSWMLPPYAWQFRARAHSKTQAVQVDAKCIREKFKKYPDFEHEFLKQLMPLVIRRLNATQNLLVDAYKAREE